MAWIQILALILPLTPAGGPRGPAFVVPSAEREVLTSPDGLASIRILIDPAEDPDAPAYLGRGSFEPGAFIPEHVHERSVEMLYILEGRGTMTIEDREVEVRAGDAVRIPAGARHSFRNTGKDPLEAVQIYVPPGPEQRFKAWPPREPATSPGDP